MEYAWYEPRKKLTITRIQYHWKPFTNIYVDIELSPNSRHAVWAM